MRESPITTSYNRAKDFQIRNDEDILRELADRVKKHFSNRDKFVVYDTTYATTVEDASAVNLTMVEHKLSPVAIICAFSSLLELMNKDTKIMKVERTKRKIRNMSFFK